MKALEKIYAGIFVLAILGVTILLNSPTVRNGDTLGKVVNQEYNEKYDGIKFEDVNTNLAIEDELEEE